tara:strand:- start:159 stop:1058 length:900 start_codon:yes stop_codon:yes gene_type:complete
MRIDDLTLFTRIADTGSITESAQQLDITTAAASAALKRLESQLDAQLFVRTTRQLRITSEGERFLQYCRKALDAVDDGILAINSFKGKIGGTVRMSISSDLGRNVVIPWLDELLDRHPELSLNVNIQDSLSDFYLDRVDVALRYGEPQDSSMVAFEIAKAETLVCASPTYIKKHGSPSTPNDLINHNCLFYQLNEKVHDTWIFHKENKKIKVHVSGNRICNDGELVKRWVTSGKGIAVKSKIDMAEDIKAGRVVEILTDYQTPLLGLWLVCPTRKQVTPAVIKIRDLLRTKCSALVEGI